MDKQGGLTMIRDMLEHIPLSERKAAEYILQNPQEFIRLTVSEVGRASGTSGAAVIRLCKSLKLSGLQELKLRVYGDIKKSDDTDYRDIVANDSYESVIHKITSNNIKAITETAEILNIDSISKAVDTIIKSDKVCLYGVGASSIVAKDAQQKFLRINKNSFFTEDSNMTATIIANMNSQDVFIGISFSGETREVVKLLELAKAKGIVTISLTKYGKTSLSEIADINLFTSAYIEVPFRSAATSSRLAQLHVMDILFMCVATRQYENAIKYLDQTKEVVEIFRKG